MYLPLLVIGLLIGGCFLAVLLIGDWREARREARRKAQREEAQRMSEALEGAWPPPPRVAMPEISALDQPAKPVLSPGTARKMVNGFFRYRTYAAGTVVAAAIIFTSYPQLGFGPTLLLTSLAAVALAVVVRKLEK